MLTARRYLTLWLCGGGEDVQWATTDDVTEVTSYGPAILGSIASSPVKVAGIDWAGFAAVIPEGCMHGRVRVEFLPFGHVYQQTHCGNADDNLYPANDPPVLMFRPSDYPAAGYAAGLADAVANGPYRADLATGFVASAVSEDELAYLVWYGLYPEVSRGTLTK